MEKCTFSFSSGKIKLYAEITECYNDILYSGRKQVNYRQAYACYRKDMNNEQRYCDDTAGVRSDDKGIE